MTNWRRRNGRRLWAILISILVLVSLTACDVVSRDGATVTAAPGKLTPDADPPPSEGDAEQTPQNLGGAYPDGIQQTVSAEGFTHPGVYVGLPELEFVRRKIDAGSEPWSSVFEYVKSDPIADVEPDWSVFSDADDLSAPCDPQSTHGCVLDCDSSLCKETLRDQINSAYTNALLWYYSGDETYAQRSVAMLNAYSGTLRGFRDSDGGYSRILLAAWGAETLVRAAEIIRYTYTKSENRQGFDVAAFSGMLRAGFLPLLKPDLLKKYEIVNNWRTSVVEGLMNSAVFLDDRPLYNEAVKMWRGTTESYIYVSSDGARPKPFPDGIRTGNAQACYWIHGLSDACKGANLRDPEVTYQNGQSLEVCRDNWHGGAGLGGIINAAETAHLQGTDLYRAEQQRIMAGVSYLVQLEQSLATDGYPNDFCANAADYDGTGITHMRFPEQRGDVPTLSSVVVYNHYAIREGLTFPTLAIPGYSRTYVDGDPLASYIARKRSGPTDVASFVVAWQTLTHYRVGDGIAAAP